eukprot:4907001-Prorocentrum_lima.AAC.1
MSHNAWSDALPSPSTSIPASSLLLSVTPVLLPSRMITSGAPLASEAAGPRLSATELAIPEDVWAPN